VFDPFGTVGQALWIGGGQWAGKSTVARILARRHGVTAYHYDYHDARGHDDRRIAARVRAGRPAGPPDPENVWVHTSPEVMAAETLAGFAQRFEWALDDLRALVSGRPIIAEGWGLRPDLVAPIVDSPGRMIVMVPSEEFRQHQIRTLPRAGSMSQPVSDPVRAQRNRIDRDRLIADDAVRTARAHGMAVVTVDGSLSPDEVADVVAAHFGPYLPAGQPRATS
jgi:2-phosphoglycerate kinase